MCREYSVPVICVFMYLISSISHELLGRLSPNGRNCDDPLDVGGSDWVVRNRHIRQFL